MRHAIMQEKDTDEIREVAISEGVFTLRMDGLLKVERGITTIDEVVKETTAVD
jgi:type IV pilus assembly protein PilB